MPASFAKSLCVYRSTNGKPNTPDAHDAFSVELGRALSDILDVQADATGSEPTGDPFSRKVAAELKAQLGARGSNLSVDCEHALNEFEQFNHVGALRAMKPEPTREFRTAWNALQGYARRRLTSPKDEARLDALIDAVNGAIAHETDARRVLLERSATSLC